MTTRQANSNLFRKWIFADGWQSGAPSFGIAYQVEGTLVRARRLCQLNGNLYFSTELVRTETIAEVDVSPGDTLVFSSGELAPVTTQEEGPLLRAIGPWKSPSPVYFHRSGLRADFYEEKSPRRQDCGILLPQEVVSSLHLRPTAKKPVWLTSANARYNIAKAGELILAGKRQSLSAKLLACHSHSVQTDLAPRQPLVGELITNDVGGLSEEFFTELASRAGYRFASEFESRVREGASQQELLLLLLRRE